MIISEAKYIRNTIEDKNVGVFCRIDGIQSSVPMSTGNSDYAEILRQVEAGELTIADAD
tara:strand:- start:273 stop:449 length:177 start_codon:yes stop_codon:yes gene_type:complete